MRELDVPELDPVGLLTAMMDIPSPSGAEERLATMLADRLRRNGVDAVLDHVGNLVATVGTGDGPTVLCLGHLDTVDDPLPFYRAGDTLFGRGAVDAKSALAAMLCAAIANRDFPGRLIVAGAVEEERPGSRGARQLAKAFTPDAAVIGEPSGWDRITMGYKGQTVVEVCLRRPGSHAAHPARKATEAASLLWQQIAGRFPRADDGEPSFERTSACLLAMNGDLRRAKLLIDFRTAPGQTTADLLRILGDELGDELGAGLGAELGGEVDLRVLDTVPAVRQSRTNAVAGALAGAIAAGGGRPRYVVKTGTSDLNVVAGSWPVPMVAYGPGDSRLDHSPDERIEISEYLRSVRVLTAALPRIAVRLSEHSTARAVAR